MLVYTCGIHAYTAAARLGGGARVAASGKLLCPSETSAPATALYSRHYYIVYVIKSLPPNTQPQLLAAIFHGDRCRSRCCGRARAQAAAASDFGRGRPRDRWKRISAGSSASPRRGCWEYEMKNARRPASLKVYIMILSSFRQGVVRVWVCGYVGVLVSVRCVYYDIIITARALYFASLTRRRGESDDDDDDKILLLLCSYYIRSPNNIPVSSPRDKPYHIQTAIIIINIIGIL